MVDEDLVHVKELAKALHLSKFTLYKAAKNGSIPYHRLGRALRFSVVAVKEAMRQPAGTAQL